jgi:hypothetical protein
MRLSTLRKIILHAAFAWFFGSAAHRRPVSDSIESRVSGVRRLHAKARARDGLLASFLEWPT